MIEHIWSVLCARSILDSTTNSLSLIDSLEEVTFGGVDMPSLKKAVADGKRIMVPMTSELVTLWSRGADDEPDQGRARLQLQLPSEEAIIMGPESDIDLTKFKRLRQRSQNPGLPFVGPGRYVFRVQLQNEAGEWHDVAAVPLLVRLEDEQPAEGAALKH